MVWLIQALFAAVLATSGSQFAHAAAPAWAAECAATDDDAARLACYDAHNTPRKAAAQARISPPANTQASAKPQDSTLATAQDSVPATAQDSASAKAQGAAPPAAPGRDFGLPKRESAAAKAAEPADLVAHVASVSERLTGELLLKLDNGQSWVQAQRKSGARIKAGERVSIAEGAFGGYLLRSDSGVSMRVRRLE